MNNTKKLAFSSVLTAAATALLFIGGMIDVIDLSAAALAAFCVILGVIEFGYRYAALIYAASAVLAFLVLPGASKTPAIYFALFFGYYPIFKSVAEKVSVVFSWILKLIVYTAAYAVISLLITKVIFPSADFGFPLIETKWLFIILYFIGIIIFVLFDIALTRIITVYVSKLRHSLGIDKLLK